MNVPDKYSRDLNTLTDYLTRPFKGDELMTTRVIYVWISLNILYDTYEAQSSYEYTNDKPFTDCLLTPEGIYDCYKDTPQDTFKKRAGVCRHFAKLFVYMARRAGLNAIVINGFSTAGLHAWNAVQINKKWQLLDTTSLRSTFNNIQNDQEYVEALTNEKEQPHQHLKFVDEEYFLPPPLKMLDTHYPLGLDKQFLKKPIPPDAFLASHPEFRKNQDFMNFMNYYKKTAKKKKTPEESFNNFSKPDPPQKKKQKSKTQPILMTHSSDNQFKGSVLSLNTRQKEQKNNKMPISNHNTRTNNHKEPDFNELLPLLQSLPASLQKEAQKLLDDIHSIP